MSDNQPEDPLVGLAEAAVTMHQLYVEYQNAGFSEAQSFELVKTVLAANLKAAL